MASSSRPRQSGVTSRQSRAPTQLPVYQPPANPLSEKGQRDLDNLQRSHNLNGLKRHLENASVSLQNNAADVNDRYYNKNIIHQRRKARKAQQDFENEDEDGEGEKIIEEMRDQVDKLTEKMEAGIRQIIDAQAAVEATENALKEVHYNVVAGGGVIAPTQSTLGASQFRQRRQRRDADADDGDSDFDEHASQIGGSENAGSSGLLKRKLDDHNRLYANLSLRNRYVSFALSFTLQTMKF